MEKSYYSKKLNEYKKSDESKTKTTVKTGCYNKDNKYYIVFYTGIKDFKVKDYVKTLKGKYRPDLNHVDEEGNTLSNKKCHGWLVDPEILNVDHLNNLIEYGTDNESLVKTLQSQYIDYDPDRPKKIQEKQLLITITNNTTETKSDIIKDNNNNNNTTITLHIKNSSNETISSIKCYILSKINEFNYITDMGEIFKTSSGWQFVTPLKMSIEFNIITNEIKQNSSELSVPKEAVFLGSLTNTYSDLKNIVLNSELPDCDEDD